MSLEPSPLTAKLIPTHLQVLIFLSPSPLVDGKLHRGNTDACPVHQTQVCHRAELQKQRTESHQLPVFSYIIPITDGMLGKPLSFYHS